MRQQCVACPSGRAKEKLGTERELCVAEAADTTPVLLGTLLGGLLVLGAVLAVLRKRGGVSSKVLSYFAVELAMGIVSLSLASLPPITSAR